MPSVSHIHICYGSESGHAETLARSLAQQSFLQSYRPTISTLNETDFTALTESSLLLIITSSFGDGEAPENAENFLENFAANPTACRGKYAVFGLGDTGYDHFCGFSRKVDEALKSGGMRPFIERVDADLNYAEIFKQWLPLLESALIFPRAEAVVHDLSVKVYDENRTYRAKVLEIKRLAQSEPPVYHLRLSLQESGIFYQAGDLIYVRTEQSEALSAEFVAWFGDEAARDVLQGKELRLLSKGLLRDLAKICGNAQLKALTKISNKKALEEYLYGHDLLDVLYDFDPEKKIGLADLVAVLGNSNARAYSISSCGKTHPEYVDLCVRQVQYQLGERCYHGTVSGRLAQLQAGGFVEIFAKSNPNFHLPEEGNAPIVMIGSGTGIAPFIGFLQNLAGRKAKTESYLFFGERYRAKDFLYQAELEQYLEKGTLHGLFTAFSRDQAEKFYVQHALLEQSGLIWSLIEKGARFYICGGKAMSKAVDEALKRIAEQVGGQSSTDAFNSIVAKLVAEGRLYRDVY